MLMFAFGNALARAHKLYGTEPLQRPITVQSVGTNGRVFEFLVFQLNTTDLVQDDGIKNQVSWSPIYSRSFAKKIVAMKRNL
ncbi:39S ribosomal protein L37, mitochondrial-like [Oryzias melastigma]|uniref:39S ribosomal protein L37, mitochondrial-like n=1 Tax=Oryzias melastigma TaxID=30732 RepID=UPI00168D3A0D|nr:39S ribosomal protein L37, mitochondrial-like [Oryzias melastigma]